jgi:ABC-2 type transport system permease protein
MTVKKTILDSLKNRKFRFGGYAALLVVAALAIVVGINLVVDQIPARLDMTQERLYSVSDQTKKLLDGLSVDVTVTTLGRVGTEDKLVKEVLDKMAARSRHIKLQTIDPETNPGWAKTYTSAGNLQAGSLVVAVSDTKFKTIDRYDLYNYQMNEQTYQNEITSLAAEQRLVSALQYVTATKLVTVYTLKGYGAAGLADYGLATTVTNQNYAVKDLELIASGSVPSDADVVILANPALDLTAADADHLRTYLAGGGRMLVLLDLAKLANRTPQLEELLGNYGLGLERLLVVEGDSNRFAYSRPYYLLPKYEYHDIVAPLSSADLPLLVPAAMALKVLDLKKQSLTLEALLTTSANSWGKVDYSNATTTAKERGDLEGPFTLAYAVTDPARTAGARDAKLVVVSSAEFLQTSLQQVAAGNMDFFLNSLSWLSEKKDDISVSAKSLQSYPLRINSLWGLILSAIVVLLIPLGTLGAGLAVWLRRRHL